MCVRWGEPRAARCRGVRGAAMSYCRQEGAPGPAGQGPSAGEGKRPLRGEVGGEGLGCCRGFGVPEAWPPPAPRGWAFGTFFFFFLLSRLIT